MISGESGDDMSIDGLFLHQVHAQMKPYLPCKINKIYLVSDTELLLYCRGNHQNFKLMISTHPQYARMNVTNREYPTPEIPGNFTMLLRKHLEGGYINSFEQEGLDRVFTMTISSYNEIGDRNTYTLYIELMGKYANVILCDETDRIMDALKRIPPYENTKRILQPGARYTPVEKHEKKDPRISFDVDPNLSLVKQFHGVSPMLASEIQFRMANQESFQSIMQEILTSSSMYIHHIGEQIEFHCIPLKHLNVEAKSYPIMEGFDVLFYHKEEKDRIRQQTGDLYKFVRRELTRNKAKLIKLEQTMDDALHCEHYRIQGELLYAYANQVEKGMKSIILPSFENDEPVTILLDPKLDARQNAKKQFQKYNKGKTAQVVVAEQIDKTKQEIEYFEVIEAQLAIAGFQDAKEIRQELATHGYMKQLVSKIRKKKEVIPAYLTFVVEEAKIHVGKNNIQNEYVTWKLAKKHHTWLHAKDLHGSHVVIDALEITEPILRAAANLAAVYSQGRQSSSVPVNYCLVKDIKKIPGSAAGLVSLSSYKTIYIDPNEDAVASYQLIKSK